VNACVADGGAEEQPVRWDSSRSDPVEDIRRALTPSSPAAATTFFVSRPVAESVVAAADQALTRATVSLWKASARVARARWNMRRSTRRRRPACRLEILNADRRLGLARIRLDRCQRDVRQVASMRAALRDAKSAVRGMVIDQQGDVVTAFKTGGS
jgi:hypothetical protein